MAIIRYPLAKDTITKEDRHAYSDWIESEPEPQLTMGPLVKKYEEKWSQWLGCKYSVACASGSDANLLMVSALLESERLKNKRVIVPSAAWNTSISPFIQLGFEPIMCEADPFNFGLDIDHLQYLLNTHRPSTVMLVQALGVPANMEEIIRLKDQYNFFLLEDACAAMGSSYRGQKVGTFGNVSSISTFYGHQFSTVEGGMVSTNDKELYELMFMLRSHGWIKGLDPEARKRYLDKYEIKDLGTDFVFIYAGYNFRLTDDHAFFGLRQLDRMNWLVERRYANHLLYQNLLKNYFSFQFFDEDSTVCSIHFCALAKNEKERNFVISRLEENGIETRPFTSGNQGLQPYWFKKYGKFNGPIAIKLYACGFFLPNYPTLKQTDIETITAVAIRAVLEFRRDG